MGGRLRFLKLRKMAHRVLSPGDRSINQSIIRCLLCLEMLVDGTSKERPVLASVWKMIDEAVIRRSNQSTHRPIKRTNE